MGRHPTSSEAFEMQAARITTVISAEGMREESLRCPFCGSGIDGSTVAASAKWIRFKCRTTASVALWPWRKPRLRMTTTCIRLRPEGSCRAI